MLAFLSLFALGALLSSRPGDQKPYPTSATLDAAVLTFSIGDEQGAPLPGRLTFSGERDGEPELFVKTDPAPGVLAVRKNVVYSLGTTVAITVPPGRYKVYATRGIEWTRAETELLLEAGKRAEWKPRLARAIDTTGWISGDFHLHTLTHSGHGDANLTERILSIVGEGVEFAVATDHNHNTDYGPTVAQVGAQAHLAHVTGNEVTTDIGHFNVFPLDPARAPVDATLLDAHVLFKLIRAEPNAFGVQPVIQVNHPRWYDIDYFSMLGLDPITGASSDPAFSLEFDSIEVLNEGAGWGYEEPLENLRSTRTNLHSVLYDWFNLLNRGLHVAAVGNSDSHTVRYAEAGFPRNFLRSGVDDPARIEPAAVARVIRAGELFATTGPFLELWVDGTPMGGSATAVQGKVRAKIRVQASPWIDVDRVKLVVGGDVVETLDVPAARERVRLEVERELLVPTRHDTWITALVEGDDLLAPIVGDARHQVAPIAVGNPVWVESDGEAQVHTSAWAWANGIAQLEQEEIPPALYVSAAPADQALLLLALAEAQNPFALRAVAGALGDSSRKVRLAAARALERFSDSTLQPALDEAWEGAGRDEFFALAVQRARIALGAEPSAALAEYVRRYGVDVVQRQTRELAHLLPQRFVSDWMVIGYFDAEAPGPLGDPTVAKAWPASGGTSASWQPASASSLGYLAFSDLDGNGQSRESEGKRCYAQCWIEAPDARASVCVLGTDDGGRAWIGGRLVYENRERKPADPLERAVVVELAAGWNRVLFEVENGKGESGLYFRVLDPELRVSAAQR